ncbi:hypothetical protein [Streptomyces canus]|uniref:hypothetical protein n=1 Tax=Streptomyces canus TaxID=58343 RepID=UPI002E37B140|nr:hypothetical protein [Streptomyces canus]
MRGFVCATQEAQVELRELDYLRMRGFLDTSLQFEKKEGELLAAWSAEETDGEILAIRARKPIGLRYCDHPNPCVVREVSYALSADHAPRTPRCGSQRVRRACETTTSSRRPPERCSS